MGLTDTNVRNAAGLGQSWEQQFLHLDLTKGVDKMGGGLFLSLSSFPA